MLNFLNVVTDPETITFQTPETRPFCDTLTDAIARFLALEKSYKAEQAKGAAADAATLSGIVTAQNICLDIVRQCLQHLTEWIEKEVQKMQDGAQLN